MTISGEWAPTAVGETRWVRRSCACATSCENYNVRRDLCPLINVYISDVPCHGILYMVAVMITTHDVCCPASGRCSHCARRISKAGAFQPSGDEHKLLSSVSSPLQRPRASEVGVRRVGGDEAGVAYLKIVFTNFSFASEVTLEGVKSG